MVFLGVCVWGGGAGEDVEAQAPPPPHMYHTTHPTLRTTAQLEGAPPTHTTTTTQLL